MPESFARIARAYSTIFFDAYGVLKAASGVLEGVPELLWQLQQQGKQILVLTNDASQPPDEMAACYTHPEHGRLILSDHLVSSGRLATEFLVDKVRSGMAAYLGKPSSSYFITEAGLTAVPVREVDFDDPDLQAIVLLDDEGFDWFSDINIVVNLARRRNVPLVVANADLAYPVAGNEVAVAVGSLAEMIERILRKSFIRFGKPDTMMFSYALQQARQERPELRKEQVLMVGDTLNTDILGANKFGLDTALVLSGTTLASRAPALIEASGIIPTYICDSVFT
ncbi:MAG: HAD-IIA family hydrolase [Myxococcales bacterium]|nr:HAD-IIA family hydrolase [Myxococcales bacterium]MDD9969369.1 HAD-IIA family hydrolase [Myxococcales bacterium]